MDRTKSSRMGWSDVALSMDGPIVDDLVSHFVDRWNFIFEDKYLAKNPDKYEMLSRSTSDEAIRGASSRGDSAGASTDSMNFPFCDPVCTDGESANSSMQIQLVCRCVRVSRCIGHGLISTAAPSGLQGTRQRIRYTTPTSRPSKSQSTSSISRIRYFPSVSPLHNSLLGFY